MRSWLLRRSRLFSTTVAFVLAASVSVLVNVWTTGWAWPVGVGIVVLIAAQVVVEGTYGHAAVAEARPNRKTTVDQIFADVRDSEISGIDRSCPEGDVDVRQRFENVHNSRIVGVQEGDLP